MHTHSLTHIHTHEHRSYLVAPVYYISFYLCYFTLSGTYFMALFVIFIVFYKQYISIHDVCFQGISMLKSTVSKAVCSQKNR